MRAQQAQAIMHSEATAIMTATSSTDAMGLVRHCSVKGRSTWPAVASSRWWTGSSACLSGEFLLHSGSDAEHAARQYPAITESMRDVPITRALSQVPLLTSMKLAQARRALYFCSPSRGASSGRQRDINPKTRESGLNHLRFASLHTTLHRTRGSQTFLLTFHVPE